MPVSRKPAVVEEGPKAASRFERTMDRLLSVSKEELAKREAEYQEAQQDKPRRGPKVENSKSLRRGPNQPSKV